MKIISITSDNQKEYNAVVSHPLQSYEWGEFRKKTGIKVIRRGIVEKGRLIDGFQLTIHRLPHTKWTVGYLPKGNLPTEIILEILREIAKEESCIFIQLEPNVTKQDGSTYMRGLCKNSDFSLRPSAHPLFTKFTFQLDITKSEEELLKNMHSKTRYNIKVAKKHRVQIIEDASDKGFETYWNLMQETTARQKFFAHTQTYHKKMWETLKKGTDLKAHLLLANYVPENRTEVISLAAWILFTFHKTLYYPYGASSIQYRNVMASNLMMWEAIRFGKSQGMELFDMWGSLGEQPDVHDPWYGFHRLKQGYGPKLIEFVQSYDLVLHPVLYQLYKGVNTFRWLLLRMR